MPVPSHKRSLRLLLLALCLMACAGPLSAQAPLVPLPRPQASPPLSSQSHRLIPGDEVEIRIQALPDIERVHRLRSDGGLYHPLAGEIQAAGRTL